jgi:hypothetical protein
MLERGHQFTPRRLRNRQSGLITLFSAISVQSQMEPELKPVDTLGTIDA